MAVHTVITILPGQCRILYGSFLTQLFVFPGVYNYLWFCLYIWLVFYEFTINSAPDVPLVRQTPSQSFQIYQAICQVHLLWKSLCRLLACPILVWWLCCIPACVESSSIIILRTLFLSLLFRTPVF